MPNKQQFYADKVKARNTYHAQKRRYYRKTAFICPYKRSWTEAEDRAVLDHSITDSQLSAVLQRSVGAIQKRRCVLKQKNNRE